MESTTNENQNASSIVQEGKTVAVVAYLTLIGLIAAFVMNNDKQNAYARFHIRQSLGLMLTGLGTMFISWIPFLGWIIGLIMSLCLIILWITGIMNAVNGKEKTLPVLGDKYAEWFKGV